MKRKLNLLLAILLIVTLMVGCSINKTEVKEKEKTVEEVVINEKNENQDDKDVEDKIDEITLVDNAGREVTLHYPVEKAVVANRYNSELIRACGAIDKIIAVDTNTAQDREYWGMFDPEEVIGKGQNDLNYEQIVKLDPQVLILPENGAYKEAEEKLEPFGIKVFVISGYATADFESQINNIGKMFNVEEQAEEFFSYFNNVLEYIKANVKDSDKKTIYIETTSKLSTVLPGDYFYNMVEFAGGNNIFSTDYENINKSEVDPEIVINRNPDVIVKVITSSKALSGTGLYEPPTKEEFVETYKEIINRPGWEDIEAVKNNDIYFMTQFSHGGASKLVGTSYIAKCLYSDQLPELNPTDVFQNWLEKYQGFKNVEGHFYSAEELK